MKKLYKCLGPAIDVRTLYALGPGPIDINSLNLYSFAITVL